jgi:hypothetical protein
LPLADGGGGLSNAFGGANRLIDLEGATLSERFGVENAVGRTADCIREAVRESLTGPATPAWSHTASSPG